MIHVKRGKAPAVFNGPEIKEARRLAAEFYQPRNNPWNKKVHQFTPPAQFPGLADALIDLFWRKCAYCESKYIGTQPMAVEHYRPKGAVVVGGSPKKPGYYWLAAEWENLLPSCTDCNSQRGQEIPGEDFQVVGKANQFPLADEAKRWTKRDGDCLEEPLLLNPCADDPGKHLEFMEDGIVRAAAGEGEDEDPKGQATIHVCALGRGGLVALRRDHAVLVRAQIERVRELAEDFDRAPGDDRVRLRLRRELEILKSYRAPDRPFSGMARQLIDEALRGLGVG